MICAAGTFPCDSGGEPGGSGGGGGPSGGGGISVAPESPNNCGPGP